MAKQKIKSLLKGSGPLEGSAGPSAAQALRKGRGKHKARLRLEAGPAGKKRPVKRLGKKKLVRPAARSLDAAVVATEPGSEAAGLVATLASRLAGRKAVRKVKRPAAQPGALERLQVAVDEVRLGGRLSPRTRKLQTSGVPKMAQKVIEEAGEVAIEAVLGNRAALIAESADLLYNLVVMLTAAGVSLEAVWSEMDRREVTLGMAEKLPKTVDPDS